MKHLWWIIPAALVLGLLCLPASAGTCGAVSYSYYPSKTYVSKKVVVEPVYTKFVAVIPLVEFPTYSAVYVPPVAQGPAVVPPAPPQQPAQPQANNDLKQVMEMLKSMDARLQRLEAQPLAQPQQPREGPKGPQGPVGVMQAKCASCHEAASAADKGGNFTLFVQGKLAPLQPVQQNKLMKRVAGGTMPPKDATQLTDQEISELVNYWLAQK